MHRLAPILRCDIGVFTNLGAAHSEGFASDVEKLEEKLQLFRYAGVLVYSADNEQVVAAFRQMYPQARHFTWSHRAGAELEVVSVEPRANGATLHAVHADRKCSIWIPFADAASIENALHCWATLLCLGVDQTRIETRMARLEPVGMRLEMKWGIHNCLIINDAYSNDLTSLKLALDFLGQQSAREQRTVILSDILQSGLAPEVLYQRVADFLQEKMVARLIGIGREVAHLAQFLDPARVVQVYFSDTEEFFQKFDFQSFADEVILLKGARAFAFERIARRLTLQSHNTSLEINLSALKHNLNVFARHLQPGVRMLVMVKASGYGSGSAEIARLLEYQNVDYLGVAYADEGIELRKAGISLPIIVLNPEEATFESLLRYRLEPEIYNLRILRQLLAALPELGQPLPVHLKLDTGMNRLGFGESDLAGLLDILAYAEQLHVQTVFTHLVATEVPAHDHFTHEQAMRFERMYSQIAARLRYRPLRHILNSAGIVRFPEYQYDMVRLGIGLYGVDVPGNLSKQLQTVHTLQATVSQVKQLSPGQTVGYNRRGVVQRPSRIATISIGYADGLLRAAGNGNFSVRIRGSLAPIIGNVCMDMTMVDVTDIPLAQEGDEVVIFGPEHPVELLAESLGTIPYEIFTGISGRVKRVYFEE
jgi:alanine racemase